MYEFVESGKDFGPSAESILENKQTFKPARAPEQTAMLHPLKLPIDLIPAPGRVVTVFGENLPNGSLSRGIYVETRPAAPVVAPLPGRVVFAGLFRGYGNLVIIELPNDRHALISGMNSISAEIGDRVLVGEPLGEMTSSSNTTPKLYFELRRHGRPINPLPPKAARRNMVRG